MPRPLLTSREQLEALELMSAPKGVGPRHPRTFILQTGTFWGVAVGPRW
jgi:hypothetical protein